MSESERFAVGDAVLISDEYGTDQPAVVTSMGVTGHMYADSTVHVPGESRSVQWSIPAGAVATKVRKRGGNV